MLFRILQYIFPIISLQTLQKYSIRLLPIRKNVLNKSFRQLKQLQNTNTHENDFDLVMTTKNVNDGYYDNAKDDHDDNDDTANVLIPKNNSRTDTEDNINTMFWSLWLFKCMDNIANITVEELTTLKTFIESNAASLFRVHVDPNTGTVVNIPDEFAVLLRNHKHTPKARYSTKAGDQSVFKQSNPVFMLICICILVVCSHLLLILRSNDPAKPFTATHKEHT